jgi:hypothetical protein
MVPWLALLAIGSKLETIRRRDKREANRKTDESELPGAPLEA